MSKQRDDAAADTRPPRPGEELDVARIAAWLRTALPELEGEVRIAQFPGGHSNLTYLLGVGDIEMVLRRPPAGTKAASAHDMGREFRVLSKLHGVYPHAPKPYVHCQDESIIGSEFYLMQRRRGTILRRDLSAGVSLSPVQARQLCENLVDALVALHQVDYTQAGLADFGKPDGYVARQVRGWSERFERARTADVPGCENIRAWLFEKQPGDSGHVGIIHNDFKFDNVVLDAEEATRIVGVLDWEMTTLGDPFMDLGCALAYWVEADDPQALQISRMGPTHLPGMLTRNELVARYREKTGHAIDHIDFYRVFGLFRLAVIAQQIYYRFYHGQANDQRFAKFGQFVGDLSQMCDDVINKSKVSE